MAEAKELAKTTELVRRKLDLHAGYWGYFQGTPNRMPILQFQGRYNVPTRESTTGLSRSASSTFSKQTPRAEPLHGPLPLFPLKMRRTGTQGPAPHRRSPQWNGRTADRPLSASWAFRWARKTRCVCAGLGGNRHGLQGRPQEGLWRPSVRLHGVGKRVRWIWRRTQGRLGRFQTHAQRQSPQILGSCLTGTDKPSSSQRKMDQQMGAGSGR